MIYRLYPPGRLSGGCLLDIATIPAIIVSAERLGARRVKDSESAALWGWSEHGALCSLTSGTLSGRSSEIWHQSAVILQLLVEGNRWGRPQSGRQEALS